MKPEAALADAPRADLEPLLEEVARRTGARLSAQQRDRLIAELTRRIGQRTGQQFLEHLTSRDGALELARVMAVISVHKTELFRDEAQLEALKTTILAPLATQVAPLMLWSAGCSTGEEVATLIMLLAEVHAPLGSSVLGTDLAETALDQAKRLEFSEEVLRRVPPERLAGTFGPTRQGRRALLPAFAERASFLLHNLMDRPYPFAANGGLFDVIVCRNVLIYFTPEAVRATVDGFLERLKPNGVLVLSTTEPLLEPVPGLITVRAPGSFFYRKAAEPSSPPLSSPARPSAPLPRARSVEPAEFGPIALDEEPLKRGAVEEGRALFERLLESAGDGSDETESGLRRALYLAPGLAGARYLLGLLLERRGERKDAALEYRRALQLLESKEALKTAFFVNDERLRSACQLALTRLRSTRPE